MTNNLLDFISPTLHQYMEQNNLHFTDFEAAGLIYNSPLYPEEKHDRLEALAAETDDAGLKAQIATRLQIDREDMDIFKNNAEGCVYVVNSKEDGEEYPCGYFANFELAFQHGKKQDCEFDIEKHRIVGLNGMQPPKSKGYSSPNFTDHTDITECVKEYDDDDFLRSDGCFHYDKDGVLTYFHCAYELRDDREVMHLLYDQDRFENAFIFMPNPFEMGDIVKYTDDGDIGIVASTQEHWNAFLERIRSGELNGADFLDASLIVDFLRKDGSFSHGHVNPAFLEKYEPKEGDDDYEILTAGSELCKGNGNLEWFTDACDSYRNPKKTK